MFFDACDFSTADTGGCGEDAREPDVELLRASLLQILEERRAEAAAWLERHSAELCMAVERALPAKVGAAAQAAAPPLNADGGKARVVAPPVAEGAGGGGHEDTAVAPRAGTCGGEGSKGHAGSRESRVSRTTSSISLKSNRFVAELRERQAERAKGNLHDRMSRVVRSSHFEAASSVLIIVYTAILFAQLEVNKPLIEASLGRGDGVDLLVADAVFHATAHVFTVLFLLELFVKVFAFRAEFFRSAFNVFDFCIVVVTTTDLYVLPLIEFSVSNVSFLRTMRLLRMARVLRTIRTMRTFQQLRVLTHTMVLSFLSVFWSLLILFIFMLVGALFMVQILQDYILDRSNDLDTRLWANRYYGTSLKALYTMFEMTFSGCWPVYARELIEEVSPWFSGFFVLYVTLVIFTLIRIIYALLIKDTMQAAANDAEQVVQEKSQQTKALVANLSELFSAADTSGDGFLSREEFDQILSFPTVRVWMSSLGMAVQDSEALFAVFTEGAASDTKISYEEFIHGVMRLKGHGREQDILCNMRDTRRILKHCETMRLELAQMQRARGIARDSRCV